MEKMEGVKKSIGIGILWLALGLVFSPLAQTHAQEYTVIDLGANLNPNDINNLGQVVGHKAVAESTPGFFWDESSGIILIGNAGVETTPRGINDAGQVVGGWTLYPNSGSFIWDRVNGMQPLGSTTSDDSAYYINNEGEIVGQRYGTHICGTTHAFYWNDSSGIYDLETLGGYNSYPYAINDLGQVVGTSTYGTQSCLTNYPDYGFIWDRVNGMQPLAPIMGVSRPRAFDINNSGQIVGDYVVGTTFNAFFWDAASGLTTLGTVISGSITNRARGVNDLGQAVGYSVLGQTYKAFIWDRVKGIRDLNNLIPNDSGWSLWYAERINNRGEIIGLGYHNGVRSGFFLKPIALPNQPPSAPTLLSPEKNAVGVNPNDVSLEWNPSIDPDGDAVEYCVTIKEDGEPEDIPVYTGCDNNAFSSGTSFDLPVSLEPGKTYWWAVWARDSQGNWSEASEWWGFGTLRANTPPELAPIGDKTTREGEPLAFTLTATDPDFADILTYSVENLPAGASFDPASATFTWTPGYDQADNYEGVRFCVQDDGSPLGLDCETIKITVGNVNRSPSFVLPSPATFTLKENEKLSFEVQATDPDKNDITYTVDGMPAGAEFATDPLTLRRKFTWTPNVAQSGAYTVRLVATDDGEPSLQTVLQILVTVNDVPATERANDLINAIVFLNLPDNDETENKLVANLKSVLSFIQKGNVEAAANEVRAVIHKLEKGNLDPTLTAELIEQADNLLKSLPSRLNEIFDLVYRTPIGQELWPYLVALVNDGSIIITTTLPNNVKDGITYGRTSAGWLDPDNHPDNRPIQTDTEVKCIFTDVWIKLNDNLGSSYNYVLAMALVHELSHYKDAVEASSALTTLNFGDTEIRAFANGYLYLLQLIENGGDDREKANATLQLLGSKIIDVMQSCRVCVINEFDAISRDDALGKIADLDPKKRYPIEDLKSKYFSFICVPDY